MQKDYHYAPKASAGFKPPKEKNALHPGTRRLTTASQEKQCDIGRPTLSQVSQLEKNGAIRLGEQVRESASSDAV